MALRKGLRIAGGGAWPGGQAARYVIFVGTASGGALLYFLLHDAADLSTGAHVAIMLAFACPLAMLFYAVMACSRGEAADEAEAKGLTFDEVVEEKTDWASACKFSGLMPCTAALVAAAKLVLWHWLQPAAYLFALVVYWGEIDTTSRWLGAIVGVREAIYIVLTIVALFVQPAYLLVSTRATLGTSHLGGIYALILIFMPEKIVRDAVALPARRTKLRLRFNFLCPPRARPRGRRGPSGRHPPRGAVPAAAARGVRAYRAWRRDICPRDCGADLPVHREAVEGLALG